MTNQKIDTPKIEPKKKAVELECAVTETNYSLQRIYVLFDAVYERYFSQDPENAVMVEMPKELLRREYENIQLALQGIRELFGGAMSCAKTAADLIEER